MFQVGLSELETIRYVYLSLGKILIHDTNFQFSDSNTRDIIFKRNNQVDIPRTNEVVCNSSSNIFVYILRELGISAEVFYSFAENHAQAIVFSSDDKVYCFNLLGDLDKIATNRRTKYFSSILEKDDIFEKEFSFGFGKKFDVIDEDIIKQMDDKLGYTLNGLYMDDYIETLAKEFKNNKEIILQNIDFNSPLSKEDLLLKATLEFIFAHCNILNEDNSAMGINEISLTYWKLISNIFSQEDKSKIFSSTCYFDKKIGNNDIFLLTCLKCKGSYIYYLFNRKKNKFEECPKEDIKKLVNKGLKSSRSNYIPGFFPEIEIPDER